jgi:hypothetical protein
LFVRYSGAAPAAAASSFASRTTTTSAMTSKTDDDIPGSKSIEKNQACKSMTLIFTSKNNDKHERLGFKITILQA